MKNLLLRSGILWLGLLPLALPAFGADRNFQQGYESFLRRDYAAAAESLGRSKVGKGQPLHDYYLWALGRSRLETGDAAGGTKLLEELLREESGSLWTSPAKIQLARALREKGDTEASRQSLAALVPTLPPEWRGEALFQLAISDAASGDKAQAKARFTEVYLDYPTSSSADQISGEMQRLGMPPLNPSSEELSRRADKLYEAKAYPSALAAYDRLASLSEAQRVKKGESLYALRRFAAALPFLQPGSAVPAEAARSALLHRGMSLLRSGDEAGAVAEFEKVQRLYPGSPEGEEALYRAGMISHQAGRFAEAAAFFDRLAQAYPQGNFRDKALWAAAWTAYRRSEWETASRWLTAMQQGAADGPTRAKAQYWQARVLERRGDKAGAEAQWKAAAQSGPFSYYGFLALKRLQNSPKLSETPKVPADWRVGAAPPGSGGTKTQAESHFRKAEALFEVGLGRLSSAELDAAVKAAEGDPRGQGQLLNLAKGSHAYFIPVAFGQKYWDRLKSAFPDPNSAESFRVALQYPFAYRSLIQESAASSGVSPYLAVALMRQESAFMPWVSSGANARGLMQLLPTTAAGRAKAAGLGSGDLFDPAYNIRVGTAELAAMLQRFSDDWIDAFAAYNAGPGRARDWNQSFGQLPPDEFTEEIPFAETNLYVKLVLRNYWSYRTLYP